jgi:hypothetical protein
MLLTEMGQLIFSLCMAIANLATDAIVFGGLLRGDLEVSSAIYTAAYATLLCFGVVATALSMGYRIRNARLVRTQLQQLVPQGQALAAKEAHRQAQQHNWELVQTHRTKVTLSLSLLTAAVQGMAASASLSLCVQARDQPLALRCRSADVGRELLPNIRRGQHRQNRACRVPPV